MTRDQAIEACARAMLRQRKQNEDTWKQTPKVDLAGAALEAQDASDSANKSRIITAFHKVVDHDPPAAVFPY